LVREKTKAQGACHSKAAIVRRASTQTNDYLSGATMRGIQQHFTDAIGVGAKWISLG